MFGLLKKRDAQTQHIQTQNRVDYWGEILDSRIGAIIQVSNAEPLPTVIEAYPKPLVYPDPGAGVSGVYEVSYVDYTGNAREQSFLHKSQAIEFANAVYKNKGRPVVIGDENKIIPAEPIEWEVTDE